MTLGICQLNGVSDAIYYALFSFFGTIAVYNGQRIIKAKKEAKTEWLIWVFEYKKSIIAFVLLSFMICLGLLIVILPKWNQLLILFLTSIISVFYVSPFNNWALRNMSGLKIHFIALTWVGVLIVFPLSAKIDLKSITFISLLHYLYVIAVTIPFDIRDIKYDSKDKNTLPQVFGVNGSKIVALIGLYIFFIGMSVLYNDLLRSTFFYLTIAISTVLIIQMNEKRGDWYCAGLIDGSIALMGLTYLFY